MGDSTTSDPDITSGCKRVHQMEFEAPAGTVFEVDPGAHIKLPAFMALLGAEEVNNILHEDDRSQRLLAIGLSPKRELMMLTGGGAFLSLVVDDLMNEKCSPSADGTQVNFASGLQVNAASLINRATSIGLVIKL